jgi:hypothetical protein
MDRKLEQRHLQEAERHVAQGLEHIDKERRIIAELDRDGHDTSTARELLKTLEQSQRMHEEHRDHIKAELTRKQ